MKESLLLISGTTGSGKSDLALALARAFNAEIVNADSVQVYRGADIGSAKPSAETLRAVPHYLFSTVDPRFEFDAGQYRLAAGDTIREILSREKLPLLCGGTALYIRALLSGLVETPTVTDEARRMLENAEAKRDFYRWLQELDPYTAESLKPQDLARIRRALLVHLSSGTSLRRLQEAHRNQEKPYRALIFCLLPERESLYRRLDARVDSMCEQGFLTEVAELRRTSPPTARIWSTLGYRHARLFQENQISEEQFLADWKRDTRRFAKRQYTWWRHQPRVLGWKEIELAGTNLDLNVKSEDISNITDRLSDAIKIFIDRREPFSGEEVFFCVVGKKDGEKK